MKLDTSVAILIIKLIVGYTFKMSLYAGQSRMSSHELDATYNFSLLLRWVNSVILRYLSTRTGSGP